VSDVWTLLRKDLAMGPRSPVVLWAVVLPIAITLLVRGVFGGLFDAQPRLGVVDQDGSVVATQLVALEGFDVVLLDDADALRSRVEANDLDAGLILPSGFDQALAAGDRPVLDLFVGGESLASNRAVISATVLGVVRDVAGTTAPVDVQLVVLGDASLDLSTRMIPLMVIMAVAIAGAFVPAAGLLQEKENRTLDALLTSTMSMRAVLAAKGALGWILAVATGIVTLVLNDAFGAAPGPLVLAIAIGAFMMAEFGLLLGAWARDAATMFTAWKSGGILLFLPVVFHIWPDLPGWIARIGPTYWFLEPMFDLAVNDAGFGDVWPELLVAAFICIALLPVVAWVGRWLEVRLASGYRTPSASATLTPASTS